MKYGVEHAVRPLQLTIREFVHPFDDGVAVALPVAEDRQHQGRGGRRDEILADVHTGRIPGRRDASCVYIEPVYMVLLCITTDLDSTPPISFARVAA